MDSLWVPEGLVPKKIIRMVQELVQDDTGDLKWMMVGISVMVSAQGNLSGFRISERSRTVGLDSCQLLMWLGTSY